MISLARKLALQDQARAVVAARRTGSAVGRTGQVPRSSVSVGDDEVPLDDVLTGAVDEVAAGEGRDSDLAFLDDSDIESFDTVVDAGSAGDIDMVLDAQDADPDLGDEFEADADADEAAHTADMTAIQAAEDVEKAKADAEAAVQAAANAQTTADGKNARRRGVTEPAPPEGGWVQGDQWVRDVLDEDDEPVPVEVLVWNGAEFVHETTLTGELLVVGENGVIRLADGVVTAESVAAEFYYGREFHGGLFKGSQFSGGSFDLESLVDATVILNDNCETAAGWFAVGAVPQPTRSTVVKRSGSASVLTALIPEFAGVPSHRSALKEVTASSTVAGGKFSAWLYSAAKRDVSVKLGASGAILSVQQATLEAGAWTQLSVFVDAPPEYVEVYGYGTAALYIDDVVVEAYDALGSSIGLRRDATGNAGLFSDSQHNGKAALVDGQLVVESSHGKVLASAGDSGSPPKVEITDPAATDRGLQLTPAGVRILNPAGGVDRLWTLPDVTDGLRVYAPYGLRFMHQVAFAGDTDWANATLPSGVTGTARWLRYCGVIYVQFNVTSSTVIAENGVLSPAFTLPSAAWPEVNSALNAVGAGTWGTASWVSAATGACTIRNLRTGSTGVSQFYGSGQWPAPGI